MGAGSRSGRGRRWRAWLSEFAATAVLLLVMVAVFNCLFGSGGCAAHLLTGPGRRLAADAVAGGVTVGLLIVSPFGRCSGGHMNPAVSLAFWLMGALPGRDAAGYAVSQLAGSLTGVAVGRLLWGEPVADPAVGFATVRAAAGMPWWAVFASEAAATVLMLAAVTFVAARPRAAALLPAVAGAAITVLILLTGRWTGGSFNPARQFGPELFSHDLGWLWVYLVAPLVGGALFALVRRRLPHAPPLPGAPRPDPDGAPGATDRTAPRPEPAWRAADGRIRGQHGPAHGHESACGPR
ncbi:MIP/aquaporin family protein [Streptomyces sp. NPDC003374]